jgi:ATP-dependent DNA ligase
MKTFDVLYKRTKTGAIQFWNISVVPYDKHDDSPAEIRKVSGQLGTTSPIVHTENISVGKQKRSAKEQALFQAESDWKKKRDEGYKSRQDLKIDISGNLMHYSINHVKYKTLTEALEVALPEFNSDANGNCKPMLAKAVDWKKVQYPCIVQPKLDGVRCLMVVDFANPDGVQIKFFSRSGKEYTSLNHIVVDVLGCGNKIPIKFTLDGEVYSDELTFQEITSAVKKEKGDSLKLKLRVYDIVNDDIQIDRLRTILELVPKLQSEHITLVEHTTCSSHEEVKAYHDEYVSKGYEGAMIRHKTGKYGQGQRSSDLLKVKEFDETEYVIVDFEIGQREEDVIAVCHDTAGVFRAKMMGTAKYKKELLEWWRTPMDQRKKNKFNKPQLTVKHFGRTDDGLPRFPVGKSIRDYE